MPVARGICARGSRSAPPASAWRDRIPRRDTGSRWGDRARGRGRAPPRRDSRRPARAPVAARSRGRSSRSCPRRARRSDRRAAAAPCDRAACTSLTRPQRISPTYPVRRGMRASQGTSADFHELGRRIACAYPASRQRARERPALASSSPRHGEASNRGCGRCRACARRRARTSRAPARRCGRPRAAIEGARSEARTGWRRRPRTGRRRRMLPRDGGGSGEDVAWPMFRSRARGVPARGSVPAALARSAGEHGIACRSRGTTLRRSRRCRGTRADGSTRAPSSDSGNTPEGPSPSTSIAASLRVSPIVTPS